ncbi:MAG: 5-formyltetrahydrofolate cyclo-ligase [Spirochaetota bacterium]|nr:5-formyltetrahydrofolate cyclo-ligase [Spirochaetota bacterium]
MTKDQLRRDARLCRSAMSPLERRAKSLIIQEKAIEFLMNRKPGTLLSYIAFRGEVETQFLNGFILERGIALGLPVIMEGDLFFREVKDLRGDLKAGAFGIPEPNATCDMINYKNLYHAVIPGVVFDRSGMRLGYGRGYYDRFLSTHPGIFRVGLAFDCQIVEGIESEPHDQAMDLIISESEIYICAGKKPDRDF